MMEQLLQKLNDTTLEIESVLKTYLNISDTQFAEVINYALFSGGKRIRPFLSYQLASIFNKEKDEDIQKIYTAIEYIHTYSLIHDDLPSMDNDDFRRGKPSCHKKFGESNAILAGDALLNLSMETLLKGSMSSDFVKALKYIYSCSGINGMIGGQVIDLCKSKKYNEETLIYLTVNKTSKLIMASIVAVALKLGLSEKEVDILEDMSKNFGIAFQIKDDIMDYQNEISELSFTTYYGLDKAKALLESYTKKALELSSLLSWKFEIFDQLCKYNLNRTK